MKLNHQYLNVFAYMLFSGILMWFVYIGTQSFGYNWQWYRVPQFIVREIDGEFIMGPLVKGLLVTLKITFFATPIALGLGLFMAILRLSRSYSGYFLAGIYLELVRNTPLLVQMYLFYFVLSPIFDIPRFWTGVLCLAFFEAAFITEVIRGGILAIPRGQWDGAASVGLRTWQAYTKVVLPQALPIIIPPLTNSIVNLVKNSAIVSTIAIFDLTTEGRNVIAETFMSFEIWFVVAAIYLVLTIFLSYCASRVEIRMKKHTIGRT